MNESFSVVEPAADLSPVM